MKFEDFFKSSEKSIKIIGTNPLIPYLEKSSDFFADLLNVNHMLELCIFYESDSENFSQSLCMDIKHSQNYLSYDILNVHRNRISGTGRLELAGFSEDVKNSINDKEIQNQVLNRIFLWQLNLRLPMNLIQSDDKIWFCNSTHNLPTIDSYKEVLPDDTLYAELISYIDFIEDPDKGGIYLSKPNDELLQLYDMQEYPRGIYPRHSFYNLKFQRYSIWGFVFNRNGELLLQQRSKKTKDNRLLWDKSIGGHVDLRDGSTSFTAKRELVEELFLPEAEFTKYMRAELGDIIDFGEWNPKKRPEKFFKNAFDGLGYSDWILFRATNGDGDPLTISRLSNRRINVGDDDVVTKQTRFISDVYFYIPPAGYLDTHDQLKDLVELSEKTGAAYDHRLVTISELNNWIEMAENDGTHIETFTDDLLHINIEYRWLLESFSEFIKYIFK